MKVTNINDVNQFTLIEVTENSSLVQEEEQPSLLLLQKTLEGFHHPFQHLLQAAVAGNLPSSSSSSLTKTNDQEIKTKKLKSNDSTQSLDLSACWENVVNYARLHLPLEGKLMMKEDGFVYVKVDDAYIHALFPMLQLKEQGYKEPPYFRSKEAPGAHISVFYEDEEIKPKEIGETFHFELKQIIIVHASKKASYAVLQVESPELEALRKKYGLSSKLHGHEYHISLAKNTKK